jgi:hypothetical protein
VTSNDKKTKSDTAPKSDAPWKDKAVQETALSPADSTSAGYSRGEGQKPVSKAYKDNWNLIFGAKKKW